MLRKLFRRGTTERKLRDLDAIASLRFPTNSSFLALRDQVRRIDGMFSDFSMAAVDALLSFQDDQNIAGNIIEMGVYRGRSALLLGSRVNFGETIVLVDIDASYLDRPALSPIMERSELLICSASELRKNLPAYRRRKHSFRFIHIDATHAYRATFDELEIADELLSRDGIIAVDDFANLNFPQNMAAVFKYLFTAQTDLTPFLITSAKAYLCRRSAFRGYADFVLERMIAEMASREVPVVLARTDIDPEFGAIHMRRPENGETEAFYGKAVYGPLYSEPN